MEQGYYWIYFKDEKEETIGYYEETGFQDNYPWTVIGFEESFENKDIKVIRKVK